MIALVGLPEGVRTQIAVEARRAFPRECCGLLEGLRNGDMIEIAAAHPARNLSEEADRFEVDPADHFRLLRATRNRGTEIVGCYHSHPNGRAEPSDCDLAGASEEEFVWLIAALSGTGAPLLRAFAFAGGRYSAMPLTETA